jgi:hypothetical protein
MAVVTAWSKLAHVAASPTLTLARPAPPRSKPGGPVADQLHAPGRAPASAPGPAGVKETVPVRGPGRRPPARLSQCPGNLKVARELPPGGVAAAEPGLVTPSQTPSQTGNSESTRARAGNSESTRARGPGPPEGLAAGRVTVTRRPGAGPAAPAPAAAVAA